MRQCVALVSASLVLGLLSTRATAKGCLASDPDTTRAALEREPTTRFEGRVQLPDGEPAVGALVVSDAGGRAVTDEDGVFALEVQTSQNARSIHLTAVSSCSDSAFSAQRSVSFSRRGRHGAGPDPADESKREL